MYFSVLGRSIIVLDSYDIACEILDKRSRNYSDRPDSVMAKLYVICRACFQHCLIQAFESLQNNVCGL